MSGVNVRTARPAELETLVELASAFYTEGGFTTTASELHDNLKVLLLCDSARVAVADADDAVLGFAITTLGFGLEQGVVAEPEDLFVRPTDRRNGIAQALIDDSAGWARARGCRTLELVVAPDGIDATHLLSFYTRRGFADLRRLLARSLAL